MADVRQVIESVEVRGRIFEARGGRVAPAHPGLRPFRKMAAAILERQRRHRRRHGGPPLIEQRRPARREPRHPHAFEGIGVGGHDGAHARDGEILGVDDVHEVARRKTIGRRDDVGLAPADELLAGVECETAARDRRGQPADRQRRSLNRAIPEIHVPGRVHLIVRVRARVQSGGKLDPGPGLGKDFFAAPQIANRVLRVVRRVLRIEESTCVDEAALGQRLSVRRGGKGRRERRRQCANDKTAPEVSGAGRDHCRRSAWMVKSSSCIGTLYWSLSSVRRVRLPRATSSISSCRAVQIPWTF